MQHEINRLRELVDLQDAKITMQDIELAAYRSDGETVFVMAWKAIDYQQQDIDDGMTHTRMVLQRVDGSVEEHQYVIRGEGAGMTGVTTVVRCA